MLEKAKKEENIQRKENKNQKTKILKTNKGITLIALVVTIVVLLILAGVSIVVLFGDNGMIKTAQNSTLQTKLAEIEERANIAYADLNTEKYKEGKPNKVITMLDMKTALEKIDKEKYQIRVENLEENEIKGINLDKESIKLGKGNKATIEAAFDVENNASTHYYVKVEEKYYEINIQNNHIILEKTNGKTEKQITNIGEGQTKKIIAVSSNNNVVTITEPITQKETGATIEITGGTIIGEEASITVSYGNLTPATCTVIIKLAPTSTTPNNTPIQNGYGKIDVIWLDENNNVIAEPKAPILGTTGNKMIPVKWNGTEATATLVDTGVDETNPEITKADGTKEKDWYDYENHRWANARTNNQSYFVWIPRYAYRITYYESKENQTSPVGYCDGYGMWRPDGTLEYKLDNGIESIEAADGNLYIVHPAFGSSNQKAEETNADYTTRKTQNINNGGWGDTLTGFWFAKFGMSGTSGANLKSSPGKNEYLSGLIGQFYTWGRTATYGQTGATDSFDSKTSFMNSHMVKNSEWGAVAYLTHSKFGLNGEEITKKNGGYTGGEQAENAYLSNQNQSTTANPYGVYDMSGGAFKFTAAFNALNSGNGFDDGSSAWTSNTKLTKNSNSTKYATRYENSSSKNNGNLTYTVGKIGDATKEVYGWFGDSCRFPAGYDAFFGRSCGWENDPATGYGIFAFYESSGFKWNSGGFRAALTP